MGGYDVGQLYGAMFLDDSQFTEAVTRAGGKTALFKLDVDKLKGSLIDIIGALNKAGYDTAALASKLNMAMKAGVSDADSLSGAWAEFAATLTLVQQRALGLAATQKSAAMEKLSIDRDAITRQREIYAQDILNVEGSIRIHQEEASARVALANKIAVAEARLVAEQIAADKASVASRILRYNQEAQGAVMAAAIEKEAAFGGSFGLRVTGSGVSPRGFIGQNSGPLLGAAAGAFGLYELGKMTVAAADAARETQNLADRLGLTWEQARGLEQGAKLAGIQLGGLQQSSYHLAQALEEGSGAGKKTAAALEELGVTGSSTGELLLNTLMALSKITDETKRMAVLHEVFQKQSQALVPYVKNLDDLNTLVSQLGPNLNKNLSAELDKAAHSFTALGVAWDKFKERVASGPLGKVAAGTADAATNFLDPNFSLFNSFKHTSISEVDSNKALFDMARAEFERKTLAAKALKDAQEEAQKFRDLRHETLDDLERDLAETKTVIKELYAELGSKINPLPAGEERNLKTNELSTAEDTEADLKARIKQLKKTDGTTRDVARMFSNLGLQDFKTQIAELTTDLNTLMSAGLLNPAQVEMASNGIQKLKDDFANLGKSMFMEQRPENKFGTQSLLFQMDDLKKESQDALHEALRLNAGLRRGSIGQAAFDKFEPDRLLSEAGNNTEKAVEWAAKWSENLARVEDRLNKINAEMLVNTRQGRIDAIGKSLGFSPQGVSGPGADSAAASQARNGFNELKQLQAPVHDLQEAAIRMFEEEGKAAGRTAEYMSQTHKVWINGVRADYDTLKDIVARSGGLLRTQWNGLMSDLQGIVMGTIGKLGGAIFDDLFPDFTNPKNSDPLKPLVDSLRSAFEQLSAYSDPKAALGNLITSIQKAGTAAQANAIAVKYFGNTAGPLLASELRNGTISANDLKKAIDAASASTVDYANQTVDKVSQLTLLWRQLVKDIVVSIIERLIGIGLVSLLTWLGIVGKGTNTLASAMDQVFTKLAIKLGVLFKKLAADITLMVKSTARAVEDIINGIYATATVVIRTVYETIGSPDGGGGGGGGDDWGSLFNFGGNGGFGGGIPQWYYDMVSGASGGGSNRGGSGVYGFPEISGASGLMHFSGPIHVTTNDPREFVRQLKTLRLVQNT